MFLPTFGQNGNLKAFYRLYFPFRDRKCLKASKTHPPKKSTSPLATRRPAQDICLRPTRPTLRLYVRNIRKAVTRETTKGIADELGISTHAIRFYEGKGMIHIPRNEQGNRIFDEETMDWLRAIVHYRNYHPPDSTAIVIRLLL